MPDGRFKIMLVDDHPGFREVVKTVLQTAAVECVQCQNGKQALELYAQTQPDLVLMDIAMENLDGLRATAEIKARYPAARIMILTQYDEPGLRPAAERAGACGYILKENLLTLPNLIQTEIQAATQSLTKATPS